MSMMALSPLYGKVVPEGYYEGNEKVIMLVDNIMR